MLNSQRQSDNKKFKADAIVIAFCLLLSAVLYLLFANSSDAGTTAVVRINGEIVAEYSLAVNGSYSVNNGTNVIIIENGEVYMSQAHCPDKLCVKQGKISRSGECITCLPNKVTVTIEGGTAEFDSVVG